jgi:hypothetical protein
MPAIQQIRIDFAAPIELSDDQVQAVVAIAAWICDAHMGRNPGRVMWPAGIGQLMTVHPLMLSDDEPIPFDPSVFHIECAEREDFDQPSVDAPKPAALAASLAWGQPVRRVKGGYRGPGRIRGWGRTEAGNHRVIVGHVIEGGEGELLHIYTPGEIEPEKQA